MIHERQANSIVSPGQMHQDECLVFFEQMAARIHLKGLTALQIKQDVFSMIRQSVNTSQPQKFCSEHMAKCHMPLVDYCIATRMRTAPSEDLTAEHVSTSLPRTQVRKQPLDFADAI